MDDAMKLVWRRYQTWAATARNLKKADDKLQNVVLALTILGTVAGTLSPFSPFPKVAGYLGAAALALATYFGRELLSAAHQQNWTQARALAEVFKSEAYKYMVQVAPYDGPDRASRLSSRVKELDDLSKGRVQFALAEAQALEGVPTEPLSIDSYIAKRVNDQKENYYRKRAADHAKVAATGRAFVVVLGAIAAVLSISSAASKDGTFLAALLGIATTVGGAIGAYFRAGHYEALAVKYRETADALDRSVVEFRTAPSLENQQTFVLNVETLLQAENSAWLNEMGR